MKSTLVWPTAFVILAIGVVQVPRQAAAENPFGLPGIEMFNKLDTNRDKRLSEQEFVGERSRKAREKARKQFRRLDKNNDRWLSFKELSEK